MALVVRRVVLSLLSLGLSLTSVSCSKQTSDGSTNPTKANNIKAAALANKAPKPKQAATPPSAPKAKHPASGAPESEPQPLVFLQDDIPGAIAQAKQKNIPVFIRFTADSCKDCGLMDASMLPLPEIRQRLDQMVLVSARTDCENQVCKDQRDFAARFLEKGRYVPPFIPLYFVLDPHTGTVMNFKVGITKEPKYFESFLQFALDFFKTIKPDPASISNAEGPNVLKRQGFGGTGSERQPLIFFKDDIPGAMAQARKNKRPLIVNVTGYHCTGCRYMEAAMFSRPEIQNLLEQMVLVSAYTDCDAQVCGTQRENLVNRFNTAAIPFFAIIEPQTDKVLATFEDMTLNPKEYETFLRAGLDKFEQVKPKTRAARRRARARARNNATRKRAAHRAK